MRNFLFNLLLLFCFGSGTLLHGQATTTPGAEWQKAPNDFLASRWDVEALIEMAWKWGGYRAAKQSSALIIIDSGFSVLELGEVDRPIKCASVRKSFLNALYGRLDAEGKLDLGKTLEDLVVRDLTMPNATESQATLLNLLSCRSGVYLPAESETSKMKERKPKRGSHAPGTYYYYNNWDFNAAGLIYERLARRSIFEAFENEIAIPLGMQDFNRSEHTWYHHDNKDEKKSIYPAYHFRMSARDRARFGLLYLQSGKWGAKQIIPESWIEKSVHPWSTHETDPEQLASGASYGLLWWVSDTGWIFGNKIDSPAFSARGYGGQFIAVLPGENLIIAHANDTSRSDWKDLGDNRKKLIQAILAAKR